MNEEQKFSAGMSKEQKKWQQWFKSQPDGSVAASMFLLLLAFPEVHKRNHIKMVSLLFALYVSDASPLRDVRFIASLFIPVSKQNESQKRNWKSLEYADSMDCWIKLCSLNDFYFFDTYAKDDTTPPDITLHGLNNIGEQQDTLSLEIVYGYLFIAAVLSHKFYRHDPWSISLRNQWEISISYSGDNVALSFPAWVSSEDYLLKWKLQLLLHHFGIDFRNCFQYDVQRSEPAWAILLETTLDLIPQMLGDPFWNVIRIWHHEVAEIDLSLSKNKMFFQHHQQSLPRLIDNLLGAFSNKVKLLHCFIDPITSTSCGFVAQVQFRVKCEDLQQLIMHNLELRTFLHVQPQLDVLQADELKHAIEQRSAIKILPDLLLTSDQETFINEVLARLSCCIVQSCFYVSYLMVKVTKHAIANQKRLLNSISHQEEYGMSHARATIAVIPNIRDREKLIIALALSCNLFPCALFVHPKLCDTYINIFSNFATTHSFGVSRNLSQTLYLIDQGAKIVIVPVCENDHASKLSNDTIKCFIFDEPVVCHHKIQHVIMILTPDEHLRQQQFSASDSKSVMTTCLQGLLVWSTIAAMKNNGLASGSAIINHSNVNVKFEKNSFLPISAYENGMNIFRSRAFCFYNDTSDVVTQQLSSLSVQVMGFKVDDDVVHEEALTSLVHCCSTLTNEERLHEADVLIALVEYENNMCSKHQVQHICEMKTRFYPRGSSTTTPDKRLCILSEHPNTVSNVEDTCPVCYIRFIEPLANIFCKHVVCKRCILRIIETQRVPCCPICRKSYGKTAPYRVRKVKPPTENRVFAYFSQLPLHSQTMTTYNEVSQLHSKNIIIPNFLRAEELQSDFSMEQTRHELKVEMTNIVRLAPSTTFILNHLPFQSNKFSSPLIVSDLAQLWPTLPDEWNVCTSFQCMNIDDFTRYDPILCAQLTDYTPRHLLQLVRHCQRYHKSIVFIVRQGGVCEVTANLVAKLSKPQPILQVLQSTNFTTLSSFMEEYALHIKCIVNRYIANNASSMFYWTLKILYTWSTINQHTLQPGVVDNHMLDFDLFCMLKIVTFDCPDKTKAISIFKCHLNVTCDDIWCVKITNGKIKIALKNTNRNAYMSFRSTDIDIVTWYNLEALQLTLQGYLYNALQFYASRPLDAIWQQYPKLFLT